MTAPLPGSRAHRRKMVEDEERHEAEVGPRRDALQWQEKAKEVASGLRLLHGIEPSQKKAAVVGGKAKYQGSAAFSAQQQKQETESSTVFAASSASSSSSFKMNTGKRPLPIQSTDLIGENDDEDDDDSDDDDDDDELFGPPILPCTGERLPLTEEDTFYLLISAMLASDQLKEARELHLIREAAKKRNATVRLGGNSSTEVVVVDQDQDHDSDDSDEEEEEEEEVVRFVRTKVPPPAPKVYQTPRPEVQRLFLAAMPEPMRPKMGFLELLSSAAQENSQIVRAPFQWQSSILLVELGFQMFLEEKERKRRPKRRHEDRRRRRGEEEEEEEEECR
ncbi:hypothetical protein TYRP_000802 [Tyrophagus putrescentiae]|nr:hypothetical protein TYRP_000802 [Tyrophagus putrescentiae]